MNGSVYEPETIDFMVANCGAGDSVHAGTFFGDFLPALSRACVQGAKVWAFEPNLENFRCAELTCKINGLSNVELLNIGLDNEKDALHLVTVDARGRALGEESRFSIGARSIDDGRTELVEIGTLDNVVPIDRNVSVLQLDIEGHEELALTGAMKMVARCLPIIIVETLPSDDWLDRNLFNLGYRVTKRVHRNTIIMPPEDRSRTSRASDLAIAD